MSYNYNYKHNSKKSNHKLVQPRSEIHVVCQSDYLGSFEVPGLGNEVWVSNLHM